MTRRRVALVVLLLLAVAPAAAQAPESRDMRLVGQHDLQARSAYQPLIVKQGERFIAYVGHRGGRKPNPLTAAVELNGTSILDVADPRAPKYLHHIPGAAGEAEDGGAAMVRVCSGDELPRAARGRWYLLRTLGRLAQEIWDVTDPAKPTMLTTVVAGLGETHKNWWECASGVGYLVSDGRPQGWRTSRMTKIYDLGDPAHPRLIRDRDRVYFAYGTSAKGVLQIVDRKKLLEGPAAPTRENLNAPEVGRLVMNPDWGGHTSFPVLGVPIAGHADSTQGLVDITDPARPQAVSTFEVPEGDFCGRGGRFGPHSSNESFTPIYYGRLVFLAYFNAGVRAVDIRDPFHPREAAFYIPAVTPNTALRCVKVDGADRCKTAIQTNNLEVDDRGYIYIVDRANTGLHILELTGAARAIAALP